MGLGSSWLVFSQKLLLTWRGQEKNWMAADAVIVFFCSGVDYHGTDLIFSCRLVPYKDFKNNYFLSLLNEQV